MRVAIFECGEVNFCTVYGIEEDAKSESSYPRIDIPESLWDEYVAIEEKWEDIQSKLTALLPEFNEIDDADNE